MTPWLIKCYQRQSETVHGICVQAWPNRRPLPPLSLRKQSLNAKSGQSAQIPVLSSDHPKRRKRLNRICFLLMSDNVANFVFTFIYLIFHSIYLSWWDMSSVSTFDPLETSFREWVQLWSVDHVLDFFYINIFNPVLCEVSYLHKNNPKQVFSLSLKFPQWIKPVCNF